MNVNVPVCIAKRCETGDVEQSNTNCSGDATASNESGTWQGNDQHQSGYGGDATTGAATTGGSGCWRLGWRCDERRRLRRRRHAVAGGVERQQHFAGGVGGVEGDPVRAGERNVPVCVAGHCETGDVEQSNRNRSGDATAWNANRTGQSNEQSQKGVGGDARSGEATVKGGCCGHGTKGEKPCKDERDPKPYGGTPCKDAPKGGEHGGSATTGNEKGGATPISARAAERQPHFAGCRRDLAGEAGGRTEPRTRLRPGQHGAPCRSC